jgi:hypothetical protein
MAWPRRSLLIRFAAQIRPVLRSRVFLTILGVLLALDVAFMLAYPTRLIGNYFQIETFFHDSGFMLDKEGGYTERFEHLKTAICICSLGGCWGLTRQPVYAAAAAVFGLALADNALMLHETWGEMVSGSLQGTEVLFRDAPEALGELTFFAAEGAAALALLLPGFRRSAVRHRMLGLAFAALILALAGFAVALDLLHAAIAPGLDKAGRIFALVEDGGEFFILSLACALASALCFRFAAARRTLGGPEWQPPEAGCQALRRP